MATSHARSVQRLAEQLQAWTPSLLPHAERLALAAEHDVLLLITGETGTGKTFLARLIHDHSRRAAERFLPLPCGAIPANLIESELFGHEKGAFTGADRPRLGKFAAAGQGTLLLDEIDTLPLEQQANLLRIVETGEYETLGGSETRKIACRIVAASNRDLRAEVAAGRFREDLYYRLNVMVFRLPPLRERSEDLPSLIRGLCQRYADKFAKAVPEISRSAWSLLERYTWPGNLRELENTLQSAVLVADDKILPEHLPECLHETRLEPVALPLGNPPPGRGTAAMLSLRKDQLERALIEEALARHEDCRTAAAKELGISRVALYKKMRRLGLMPPTQAPGQGLRLAYSA